MLFEVAPGSVLSTLGDVASVVSLAVSGYAALTIRMIKSNLISDAMLPTIINNLEDNIKNIVIFLRNFEENRSDIRSELEKCRVNLERLTRGGRSGASSKAKIILHKISRIDGRIFIWFRAPEEYFTESSIRDIHHSFNGLMQEIKYLSEEKRFGG